MTYRAQQSRLMRSLGFTIKPHGYGRTYHCVHWQHQPSGAKVILDPTKRYRTSRIVACAIASGIERRLLALEQTIARPIGAARLANSPAFDMLRSKP